MRKRFFLGLVNAVWPVLFWPFFLILLTGSILVAFDFSFVPLTIAMTVLLLLITFQTTYVMYYLSVFFVLFLGLTVSLSTGSLQFGARAFGGSIDLFLGEVLILVVLAIWGLKIFLFWIRRRHWAWRPVLPLWRPYAGIFFAHLFSVFSFYPTDPVLVLKFTLRPVLFSYFAFIALPVNLIRSVRRLRGVLIAVSSVGILGALNGLLSFWAPQRFQYGFLRAQPIALFGVNPLGDNHNLLGELLVFTAPVTLALAFLTRSARLRFALYAVSGFQIFIALMTFSRATWIVCAMEAVFLLIVLWGKEIRQHLSLLFLVLFLLTPLAIYQAQLSLSYVAQSSNTTRWMLTDIAWSAFKEYPLLGSGAGTHVDRVSRAQVFQREFGDPLDAHGFIQKLMVETGLVGVTAYLLFLFFLFRFIFLHLQKIRSISHRRIVFLLIAGAGGAVVYQFANTTYWTAHLWLPIGLCLATVLLFSRSSADPEFL